MFSVSQSGQWMTRVGFVGLVGLIERKANSMNDQSTLTGEATIRPTIKQLIRNLEQAAWASGTDEYREGVSDAACIRRGNEQAAARNALEEAVSRRDVAWKTMLTTLREIAKQHLRPEMEEIDGERGGDFEYAYEKAIVTARDGLVLAERAEVPNDLASKRTQTIRNQQRSGGGKITAVMVSGQGSEERQRVQPVPSSPHVEPDGEFFPMGSVRTVHNWLFGDPAKYANANLPLVYVITAHNGDGEQKECLVVTSLPLATTIRDALKGIWGGGVVMSSRTVDEVPSNILAEIDVMEHPSPQRDVIGGGRHG